MSETTEVEVPEAFSLRAVYKGAPVEIAVRSEADSYDAARALLAITNDMEQMANLLMRLDPIRFAADLGDSGYVLDDEDGDY